MKIILTALAIRSNFRVKKRPENHPRELWLNNVSFVLNIITMVHAYIISSS